MDDDELNNDTGNEPGAGGGGEGDGGPDLDAELASAIDAGIEEAGGPSSDTLSGGHPASGASESAEGTPDAEGEGEGKEGDGGEEEGDGKEPTEPDHVNDPIPDEIKGRTRERIESLVSQVKELSQVQTQYNEIMGMIAETKATPEQYGMVLEYLGAVNSGDEKQIRAAMQTLQNELDALAGMLGEAPPGKDLLDGHQDLQDAVEVGDITRQHAEELAAARNQRRAAERRQQQTSQTQQEQTERQQAMAQGKADLNALDAELKKSDPQYAQKRAVLVEMLKPVMAQIHPSQWAATFKAAYEKLPAPTAQQQPGNAGGGQGGGQQPLRARQPAGGQQKAPTTLEEAIDLGIEQAGR